jgi:putative ABC transport system permease protein
VNLEAIFSSGFEQGLLYCFMVLGVFITFRVLDFPDLTVDGSLPLGAATAAALMVHGVSPWLATAAAVGAGMCAGTCTGFLHLVLKSGDRNANNYGPKLLAGILTMTALYTVNLRVMGRSNTPLLGVDGVFEKFGDLFNTLMSGWPLIAFLFVLAIIVKYVLDWFLHTEFGLCLQATGDNEQMIRSMGTNTNVTRIVGLALANGLVAFTGALVAQQQGFADVGMGLGTIVAGLAGVIMGEVIFGIRNIGWVLFSVIGGSIVYRLLIAASLQLGIAPQDLKLLTAALVVAALAIPTVRSKVVRM